MRALVVTHSATEHVGRLGEWLEEAGLQLEHCEPWDGDAVPTRVDADALVVMGGPQQAYDDSSAPWLRATKDLLAQAVREGVPTLGVCLGGQLLAAACGGRVERGAEGPEVGARLVARRDAAEEDPLFSRVPLSPVVVQWHWDAVVELPPGAVNLASSSKYPHQAFRVGERAWGLQFHVETPPEMVAGWAEADAEAVRRAGLDPEVVLARTLPELDEVRETWRPVAHRFVDVVAGRVPRALPLLAD